MKIHRCKHCDRPVEWIEVMEPSGIGDFMTRKKVALDPKAPTYHFDDDSGQWIRSIARASHFWTCPILKQHRTTISRTVEPKDPRWNK